MPDGLRLRVPSIVHKKRCMLGAFMVSVIVGLLVIDVGSEVLLPSGICLFHLSVGLWVKSHASPLFDS